MTKKSIPIIIIGSARNGTTNLENTIASFPEVAGVEHWLHHGSHESNIYSNCKYWGKFNHNDEYIHFLYQYASSDYFQLCEGDLDYHLAHKRTSFYSFFLDLMDCHAENAGKDYWVTKLDPCFFFDDAERETFFSLLNKRYEKVKIIRIKRDFKDAFISYRNMEGENYRLRNKFGSLLPTLLYEACRYVLIYKKLHAKTEQLILDLSFDEYISKRKETMQKIAHFLSTQVDEKESLTLNRFQVNTSFNSKDRKPLPNTIVRLIPKLLTFLQAFPFVPKAIWRMYFKLTSKSEPIYRRLLKYRYFRGDLIKELQSMNATALAEKVQDDTDDRTVLDEA
jgi:hypothetical protein